MNMNCAIVITLTRIFLIPVFCCLFYTGYVYMAIATFSLAAVTDWLDGFIARRFQLESMTGAWLDFVADKIMLIAGLFLLVYSSNSAAVALCAIVMTARELVSLGLRGWLAETGQVIRLKVSRSAKAKTAMQFLSIILILLLIDTDMQFPLYIAWIMFYLSVILTVYSMFGYASQCWNLLSVRE